MCVWKVVLCAQTANRHHRKMLLNAFECLMRQLLNSKMNFYKFKSEVSQSEDKNRDINLRDKSVFTFDDSLISTESNIKRGAWLVLMLLCCFHTTNWIFNHGAAVRRANVTGSNCEKGAIFSEDSINMNKVRSSSSSRSSSAPMGEQDMIRHQLPWTLN